MKLYPFNRDAAGTRLVAHATKILAIASVMAFPAMAQAGDQGADAEKLGYDNIVVTERISANGAKRAVRHYLAEHGFTSDLGPGAARVRSVSLDGSTWVVEVAISNQNSRILNEKHYLFVDRQTAVVSETPPADHPERVAAN